MTSARSAGQRRSAQNRKHSYSHATHRLREIERIISDRHGSVPDTDDADLYLMPAALCLRQVAIDRGQEPSQLHLSKVFSFWCEKWAPALIGNVSNIVRRVSQSKAGIGKADKLGRDLRLSDDDRTRLTIRTIGSYDVDRKAREKRRRAKKRERDRERARSKRAAAGKLSRAEYLANCLSQSKPWEAEGISRRTYERRRKALAKMAA